MVMTNPLTDFSPVRDYDRMLASTLASGDSFGPQIWRDIAARLTCAAETRNLTPEQARKLRDRAQDALMRARRATSREGFAAAMEVA